jgi:hypothetical protein
MIALDFAIVAALSLEEQRSLLESGDGPERLWSAWAIALRLGREALPLLRSMEGSAVPEGLRRQLLVVLAGMGERQLLRTIAETEPSPSVQATASMLYLRTAPDAASSETVSFALRQLQIAPTEVRRAILNEQELGQASIPTRELFPALSDADVAVRVACAACILKDPSSSTYSDAVRAVVVAFADERDSDVRREFLSKLPRSAVPAVLDAVDRGGASSVVDALDTALRQFGELTWRDVRDIAPSATLELTRSILASGIQPELPDGTAWLCHAIRTTSHSDSALMREVNWRALYAIRPFLTEEAVALLAASERTLLFTTFQRALAEHVEHIDNYGPDSGDEDYVKELERLVQVLG